MRGLQSGCRPDVWTVPREDPAAPALRVFSAPPAGWREFGRSGGKTDRKRAGWNTQNFEWVHLRPDGPAFPTEVSLTCFEWKRKLLLQAIVRAVSERRHTEQTWRESEERYRARFDRSLDCLFVHDLEGRFLDANAAAPALLGYERGFGPGVFEHRAEGASRISANQITHAGCQTEGCPGGAAPEW
jgi:PAS domain-containing protein